MLLIVTYDVNTSTKDGRRRLNKVSKICCNYGQRVQNSVFECNVNNVEYLELKKELLSVIKDSEDSLRLYNLGNHYQAKTEHYGIKDSYNMEEPLIM